MDRHHVESRQGTADASIFLSAGRACLALICLLTSIGCPGSGPEQADHKHAPTNSAAPSNQFLSAGKLSELSDEQQVRKLSGTEISIVRAVDARGSAYPLILDPVCPHDKCSVKYSAAAKAYRCPCTGCRFDAEGKRVAGPAKQDLRLIYYEIRNDEILIDPDRTLERK